MVSGAWCSASEATVIDARFASGTGTTSVARTFKLVIDSKSKGVGVTPDSPEIEQLGALSELAVSTTATLKSPALGFGSSAARAICKADSLTLVSPESAEVVYD